MKEIPVFIISLKNSHRINILKQRLRNIKINYKIFYGINGNNLNKKKLKLIYSKKKTKKISIANYLWRKLVQQPVT